MNLIPFKCIALRYEWIKLKQTALQFYLLKFEELARDTQQNTLFGTTEYSHHIFKINVHSVQFKLNHIHLCSFSVQFTNIFSAKEKKNNTLVYVSQTVRPLRCVLNVTIKMKALIIQSIWMKNMLCVFVMNKFSIQFVAQTHMENLFKTNDTLSRVLNVKI